MIAHNIAAVDDGHVRKKLCKVFSYYKNLSSTLVLEEVQSFREALIRNTAGILVRVLLLVLLAFPVCSLHFSAQANGVYN